MPDNTRPASTIAPTPDGQHAAAVPPPRTAHHTPTTPSNPPLHAGGHTEHLLAHDLPGPRQLVALCGRQADELAALVEDTLTKEHTAHRAQLAQLDRCRVDLDTTHQQRVALLTLLADHLGQVNATLDDATDQIPLP